MASLKEERLESYLTGGQAGFYRLAYSYLQNREEALDAVQTAVCRALERQDSLRDEAALGTWFTRILVNTCMDLLRQRKRVTGGRRPESPGERPAAGGADRGEAAVLRGHEP